MKPQRPIVVNVIPRPIYGISLYVDARFDTLLGKGMTDKDLEKPHGSIAHVIIDDLNDESLHGLLVAIDVWLQEHQKRTKDTDRAIRRIERVVKAGRKT